MAPLKGIKSFSRNSAGKYRLSQLGIVSVELRLLENFRKKGAVLSESDRKICFSGEKDVI